VAVQIATRFICGMLKCCCLLRRRFPTSASPPSTSSIKKMPNARVCSLRPAMVAAVGMDAGAAGVRRAAHPSFAGETLDDWRYWDDTRVESEGTSSFEVVRDFPR
jgi:hypothetical protein